LKFGEKSFVMGIIQKVIILFVYILMSFGASVILGLSAAAEHGVGLGLPISIATLIFFIYAAPKFKERYLN